MNYEFVEQQPHNLAQSFRALLTDLKEKQKILVENQAEHLQQILNGYEVEELNLKNVCQIVAKETQARRSVLKQAENIRKGWEATRKRLLARNTRTRQLHNEANAYLSKIEERDRLLSDQVQREQTDLNELQPVLFNPRRMSSSGVEYQLQETTNTLFVTVKCRRFELIYNPTEGKWTMKSLVSGAVNVSLLNKLIGEFNLHNDVPQLMASLRFVASQPI